MSCAVSSILSNLHIARHEEGMRRKHDTDILYGRRGAMENTLHIALNACQNEKGRHTVNIKNINIYIEWERGVAYVGPLGTAHKVIA